jgi:hypothetical protein
VEASADGVSLPGLRAAAAAWRRAPHIAPAALKRRRRLFQLPFKNGLQAAQDWLVGLIHSTIDGAALVRLRILAELADDICGEGAYGDAALIGGALNPLEESISERCHGRMCDLLVRAGMNDLVEQHGGLLKLLQDRRPSTLALSCVVFEPPVVQTNPQMRLGNVSSDASEAINPIPANNDARNRHSRDCNAILLISPRFFSSALRSAMPS